MNHDHLLGMNANPTQPIGPLPLGEVTHSAEQFKRTPAPPAPKPHTGPRVLSDADRTKHDRDAAVKRCSVEGSRGEFRGVGHTTVTARSVYVPGQDYADRMKASMDKPGLITNAAELKANELHTLAAVRAHFEAGGSIQLMHCNEWVDWPEGEAINWDVPDSWRIKPTEPPKTCTSIAAVTEWIEKKCREVLNADGVKP